MQVFLLAGGEAPGGLLADFADVLFLIRRMLGFYISRIMLDLLGVEGVVFDDLKVFIQVGEDIAEISLFGGVAKADGAAGGAGAGGAADAVDEGFGFVGQVKVDDVGDVFDVNAPCGEVGGDQDGGFAGFEGGEDFLPVALQFVAVEYVDGQVLLFHGFGQAVGPAAGAAEDENAFIFEALEEPAEQDVLVVLFYVVEGFLNIFGSGGDWVGRNIHGFVQNAGGKREGGGGHGGGEEEGLAGLGEHRGDFADVGCKAHIEHAVGFVDHKNLYLVEFEGLAFDEVEHAAGGGDEDVDAGAQGEDLLFVFCAAVDEQGGELGVGGEFVNVFLQLNGELAGGGKDEGADADFARGGPAFFQPLDEGQDECGGFSGSGSGEADDVAAGSNGWNRLLLDRGRCGEACVCDGLQDLCVLDEVGKLHAENVAGGGGIGKMIMGGMMKRGIRSSDGEWQTWNLKPEGKSGQTPERLIGKLI